MKKKIFSVIVLILILTLSFFVSDNIDVLNRIIYSDIVEDTKATLEDLTTFKGGDVTDYKKERLDKLTKYNIDRRIDVSNDFGSLVYISWNSNIDINSVKKKGESYYILFDLDIEVHEKVKQKGDISTANKIFEETTKKSFEDLYIEVSRNDKDEYEYMIPKETEKRLGMFIFSSENTMWGEDGFNG